MSQYNRKGFTTVRAKNTKGQAVSVPVPQDSKAARIARHKQKQMARQQKLRIRQYKQRLKEEKKKYPISERSHLRLEEL